MESKLFVYILVYGLWIKCDMYVYSKIILYIGLIIFLFNISCGEM
jgi:hypothetical protein